MSDYYSNKLSAGRLRLCYDLAPPRVKQYLNAEIDFILEKIKPNDNVLELGCGYGRVLINEALRVTKPGGKVIFSSYSEKFWNDRLNWFHIQSEHGLIGEIDYSSTGNGVIVCKDGFRATTFSKEDFNILVAGLKKDYKITEVDNSSIFCEIIV